MDGVVKTTVGLPSPTDPPSNPFDRPAVAYLVSKPINVSQLRNEVRLLTGIEDAECTTQGTSEPGTVFLYVAPAIDYDLVEELISAHEADPNWGREPVDPEVLAAKQKLDSGEVLSLEEITALLRVLIR